MDMESEKCTQCGAETKAYIHYMVYINVVGNNMSFSQEVPICSPSCLVEFAWNQKEGQKKLSKSGV